MLLASTLTNASADPLPQAPIFLTQPKSRAVMVGSNYTFSVTTDGTQPVFFQWYFNGAALSNRTNSDLALTTVQLNQAGAYWVVASNVVGMSTSAVANLAVKLPSDPVYATPDRGWNYIFTGDAAGAGSTTALDGTWNQVNNSSSWARDGRGAGVGVPGGVGTTNGILTIEDDTSVQTATLDNRRFYFTHNINADASVTNANFILNNGVTLSFRARLTPPAPTDPLTELADAPNGWVNANDGKGMFGIRQAGGNGMLISFSLNRAIEDTSPTTTFNFGQAGLHMNNLNGDVRSAVVDPGEAGTINLLPLDPTVFHEFWITIQDNGAAPGTHRVSIYKDGSLIPTEFNVTAGTGSDTPFTNFVALGLPVTAQTGAYDIDYFAYKQGVVVPAGLNDPVGIVLQPLSQTLLEGQLANFTVGVTGTPPISYQWYKNGAPIPNATNSFYGTAPLLPSDSGTILTVAVSNFCGVVTNTTPALLTVVADLTPPALVSAGSLDGKTIGVCFSEPVTSASASIVTNYMVNDGAVTVTNVIFRTNNGGTSAILFVSGLGSGPDLPFTVSVTGIRDLSVAANSGGGTVTGVVQGFQPVDIGVAGLDPLVPGNTFVCDSTNYETVAGGSGLGNTNDALHFVYMPRTGDFDVWVRVAQLSATDQSSVAGLIAREGLEPGARGLSVLVSPAGASTADGTGPGLNQYEADYRALTNGPTGLWPAGGIHAGVAYSNGWIRLTRQGDFFSASYSSNGVVWKEFGQLTEIFSPTLLVGFGISAHTNSAAFPVTGLYSDLQFAKPPVFPTQAFTQTVTNGDALVLSANAGGRGPLRYQWKLNGADIPGATNATYSLAHVTPSDAGVYIVTAANVAGAAASAAITVVVRTMDYGDAPAPYPTLLAENGARHLLVSNIFLGAMVDFEVDGIPDSQGLGDDNQGVTDEDGVRFQGSLIAGQVASVEVVASTNGFLNAWMDWNGNGDWADAGEQIFTNQVLLAGTNLLSFTVSPEATANNTFARFRFSTQAGLSFTGPAPDGEVEDYQVAITHAADLAVTTLALPEFVEPGSNLTYSVTVRNFGPSLATSVGLTNALPDGVTFVSSNPSQGACTLAGNVVTCALGSIPADGAAVVTLLVQGNVAGAITNSAVVGASEVDLNLGNNARQTIGAVESAPVILESPVSLIVTQGTTATFHVSATGTSLGYQWQFNGTDLSDGTLAEYSITNVQTNREGNYTVKVSNRVGSVVSAAASLIVRVPPEITQQPQSRTNYAGSLATLGVTSTGTAPLQYQWFFNATNLLNGETNSVLALLNVQGTNTGDYLVQVMNVAGIATSSVARLTVFEADFGDAPEPGYPTTLANNGARHLIVPGVFLGSGIDFEPDGQPTANAKGDDQNGAGDEDGVLFSGPLHAGQMETILVIASTNGFLNGWIDFDRNGSWGEFDEQVFVNQPVVAGTNQLNFNTPRGAVLGTTFGRFRFSTVPNVGFQGEAPDGEVEDYQITIQSSADLAVELAAPPGVASGTSFAITLAVTNNGPSVASSVVITQVWTGPGLFVSSNPSQGTCSNAGAMVICDLGTLASGGVASVGLQLQATELGTLSNIVTVASAEADFVLSNNLRQAVVLVQDPPRIVSHPKNLSVIEGNPIVLSVEATGTDVHYQWQFQGTNLADQIGPVLSIAKALPEHAGTYRVLVGNAIETIQSVAAEVAVLRRPSISGIPDQTVDEDTLLSLIPFTIGDAETAADLLSVAATSSNPNLVPVESIVLSGAGSNRFLSILPATNQNGTANITLTVTDGDGATATTSFLLTVTPVNDLPFLSAVSNQSVNPGKPLTISFVTWDIETPAAALLVRGHSSNQALVADANVVFGGAGSNRTVTVTPSPGQSGTATLSMEVEDEAGGISRVSFDLSVRNGTRITSVLRINSSEVQVRFETVAGRNYTIEYKDSFADETWTPLQTVAGEGNPTTFADPSANPVSRFYRVREQ